MPRFSKHQKGNGCGRAISTSSNATSFIGLAALTPRTTSTPCTCGRSEKRGNGRGRALSTQRNTTSSINQAALTPWAASTPRTRGRSEKRPREHSDQDSQTASLPTKSTSLHRTRSATESSQILPLTEADIPRIVTPWPMAYKPGHKTTWPPNRMTMTTETLNFMVSAWVVINFVYCKSCHATLLACMWHCSTAYFPF